MILHTGEIETHTEVASSSGSKPNLQEARLRTQRRTGMKYRGTQLKQRSGRRVVMCATYRPPSADDTSVADYFDRVLPTIRKRGDAVILIGDFNWHKENWLGSNK